MDPVNPVLNPEHFPADLVRAMWEGDIDYLDEHYGCGCCCDEHTHECCAARMWGACRGQDTLTRADLESWMRHYGMTPDEFYNY